MAGPSQIAGVILAGGLSTRMGGGDKALLTLGGRPLLAYVIDRLRPQVNALALNANGDPARFAAFGLPIAADTVGGFAGPLAGVLAGLLWARRQRQPPEAIVTTAADTPFFPVDLAERLAAVAADRGGLAVARTNGRLHPVFGYFPIACVGYLDNFLRHAKSRKVTDWLDRVGFTAVDFVGGEGVRDPFFNINTPADLAAGVARFAEDAR
jgi:molybdopterin-guanine dinucleotide biosynthesis protein A